MTDSAEGSWHGFAGPPDYVPKRVAAAFDELMNASSIEAARQSCAAVLSSIGNNHAGTMYPAAVQAAAMLRNIRDTSNNEWSAWAAREVLTDLAESFVAEPGYERTKPPSGTTCDVVTTVRFLATDAVSRSDSLRKPGFPFVGHVRWLLGDGGVQSEPPLAPFAAAGFVAGAGAGLASFVLDHETNERTGLARGRWAFVENVGEFVVEPGTTVHITNGIRVIAEFLVEEVEGLPVDGAD